ALEKSSKQMLGRLLNEAQKELETIGVSDESLNRLIQFAREQGALGAKLTGGGKGGCIIALAKNEIHSKQLSEKLMEFGAQAVWPFVLKNEQKYSKNSRKAAQTPVSYCHVDRIFIHKQNK